MRVHRLLHETTCRLELTALEKAGAVVNRLTFNATIIETGTESYRPARAKASQDASMSMDPADTIEPTETLDFWPKTP
jgi:hypothetical protein